MAQVVNILFKEKTRNHLCCIWNIMAVDALVTQEDKDISSHGIDLVLREYCGLITRRSDVTADYCWIWGPVMMT